jgi:hypothetical protein
MSVRPTAGPRFIPGRGHHHHPLLDTQVPPLLLTLATPPPVLTTLICQVVPSTLLLTPAILHPGLATRVPPLLLPYPTQAPTNPQPSHPTLPPVFTTLVCQVVPSTLLLAPATLLCPHLPVRPRGFGHTLPLHHPTQSPTRPQRDSPSPPPPVPALHPPGLATPLRPRRPCHWMSSTTPSCRSSAICTMEKSMLRRRSSCPSSLLLDTWVYQVSPLHWPACGLSLRSPHTLWISLSLCLPNTRPLRHFLCQASAAMGPQMSPTVMLTTRTGLAPCMSPAAGR